MELGSTSDGSQHPSPSDGDAPGPDARTLAPRAGLCLLLVVLLSFGTVIGGVKLLFRLGPTDTTNGFDLANASVPIDEIERAIPLGHIRPLDDPPGVPNARAAEIGNRYLVGPDPVVRVSIGGETRAYPLRVLVFHEVIADELGGVAIAVVHHPVSGTVAVFDRRIDGAVRSFGPSGLVLDSHGLLFDRPAGSGEPPTAGASLWSPLLGAAIAGPRTGTALRFLPCEITTWDDHRTRTPEGTMPLPPAEYMKEYRKDPYNAYVGNGEPRFRVDPLPDPAERAWFSPLLLVETEGGLYEVPLDDLVVASDGPRGTLVCGERSLAYRIVDRAGRWVTVGTEGVRSVRRTYWFAWYAVRDRVEDARGPAEIRPGD